MLRKRIDFSIFQRDIKQTQGGEKQNKQKDVNFHIFNSSFNRLPGLLNEQSYVFKVLGIYTSCYLCNLGQIISFLCPFIFPVFKVGTIIVPILTMRAEWHVCNVLGIISGTLISTQMSAAAITDAVVMVVVFAVTLNYTFVYF